MLFYCHLFGESTGRLRRTEKQSDATSKRPIFHPLPLGEGRGEGSASELKKQAESETIEFRYASEGVTERHLVRDIVGIARALLSLEDWLDGQASSWQQLSDPEYTALLRCWSSLFNPLIEAGTSSRRGNRAFEELRARLPCDAVLFSGVRIPRLANMGGRGPSAYRAMELRSVDRILVNDLELIVAPVDLAWCCVFSHEAGSLAWEELFDLDK